MVKKTIVAAMLSVGAAAGGLAGDLPDGYEAVEYIASDGAQYVDTGLGWQAGLTAEVGLMYTRDTSSCILGASEGGSTMALPAPEHAAIKVRYQVETAFASGAGSRTLYLFARNDGGVAADFAYARVYAAKLRVGETVLRDYVPCRMTGTGQYGLYELKGGTFCPSQGAKPFFRPWRVGVYGGRGATGAVVSWYQLVDRSPWLDLTILSPSLAQKSSTFKNLDAVVFPGGDSVAQYNSLGSGRSNVKAFVKNGGCYYGTCAGSHLVLDDQMNMSGYKFLCNADRHERVNVRINASCKAALGLTQSVWNLGYSRGPFIVDGEKPVDGANLEVWGQYETDILGKGDVPMNGKYAILAGTYFDGRMFVTSSHPEFYTETTPLISKGFCWLSGRDDIVVDDYSDGYVSGRLNVFLDTTYSGIHSMIATILRVNNDPRMNLVKGATASYVGSSTYKANGKVAIYPAGVLGTEASGDSDDKAAIAAFKKRGGLCLFEDDGLDADAVWAFVDAIARDTRTQKSLAWGAGNALAFAGDRTVTGQDLRVTADGMYVTTFEDGDIAFEANGEGLGGDWAYCGDAVTHRVVIDNARVRAVHGNHRRNSQMTATTAGAYSPVANQAFEITLGDRNTTESAAALTFEKGAMIASGATIRIDARGKAPGFYKIIEAGELTVRGSTFLTQADITVDEGLFAVLDRDESGNAIVLEIATSLGELDRVDWVASTGTQYIDTEIDMQDKLTFEADYEWLALKASSSADHSVLFGAYVTSVLTGGSTYRYYFGYVKPEGVRRTAIETGSLKDISGLAAAAVNTRYRIVQSVNGKTVTTRIDDGDPVTTTFSAAQKSHPYSCFLFAHRSNASVSGLAKVRLYGAKVYTNAVDEAERVLARDYVPCYRAANGKYGLFDRVTRTFRQSLADEFAGAAVPENPERLDVVEPPPVPEPDVPTNLYDVVEYVESTSGGNQRIDTGIEMQDLLTFDAEWEWTAFSSTSYYELFGAYSKGDATYRFYFGSVDSGKWRTAIETGSPKSITKSGFPKPGVGTRYRIVQNVNGKTVNSTVNGVTSTHTYTAAQTSHPYSCALFCHSVYGSTTDFGGVAVGRLYSARIYTNATDAASGVLARDYRPVRCKATGEFGLYDVVTKSFSDSASAVPFSGPVLSPTVDGEPVEPGRVFETATSAKPIVYPSDVTLAGEPGAQTVVFGTDETAVPAHYTATLAADGCTVTLALNANAVPRIGGSDETEPFVVGEGKVKIRIANPIPTLWYALGWGETLGGAWNTNDYVKGAADFEDEPPADAVRRFYNVLTTDAPEGK